MPDIKQQELPGVPLGKLKELAERYLDTREEKKLLSEKAGEQLKNLTEFMKKTRTLRFRTQGAGGKFVVIELKEGNDSVKVTDSKEKGGTD